MREAIRLELGYSWTKRIGICEPIRFILARRRLGCDCFERMRLGQPNSSRQAFAAFAR